MKLIFTTIIFILVSSTMLSSYANESSGEIRVGSKSFTESVILGEIVTGLAKSAGFPAHHQKQLGGTRILWNALLAGEIDVYAEYTGTLMQEILASEKLLNEAQLISKLASLDIGVTQSLGFNNTYALSVKPQLAEQLNLQTLSDLKIHPQLKLGFSSEFLHRADGWPGLKNRYGFLHDDVRGLDHDLAYRGIAAGNLDVIDVYATDAEIAYYQLQLLTDDLNYFPVYNAVIVYRADLKQRAPALVELLQQLSGRINEADMAAMNAQVKLENQSDSQVAANFLKKTLAIDVDVQIDSRWAQFKTTTYEHLLLVSISLLAAIIVGIPLGIAAAHRPRLAQMILGVAAVMQTIPSLALFVFLIPLLGIGGPPALVALFLYSLLPIIRNTYTGLTDIPSTIQDSADALGLTKSAKLWLIELPLSARAILAGIKTSAVINVGTATLAALIGAGGYGQPILTGIRLDDTSLILQGAIPAAVLALLVQGGFELAERAIVPRGIRLNTKK